MSSLASFIDNQSKPWLSGRVPSLKLDSASNQLVISVSSSANLYNINASAAPAASRTLSLYDPMKNAQILCGVNNIIDIANTPTGAQVASASNSGSAYTLDASTNAYAIVLPAAGAANSGLYFDFYLKFAGAHDVSITDASTKIQGVVSQPTGNVVATANKGTIKFVSGTALVGDHIHMFCDGVNWSAQAWSGANGGITSA